MVASMRLLENIAIDQLEDYSNIIHAFAMLNNFKAMLLQ
jgi:hypothetical protein